MTIHAVYENGVFRPTDKVDLPESCEVEVDVRRVTAKVQSISEAPRSDRGAAFKRRIRMEQILSSLPSGLLAGLVGSALFAIFDAPVWIGFLIGVLPLFTITAIAFAKDDPRTAT